MHDGTRRTMSVHESSGLIASQMWKWDGGGELGLEDRLALVEGGIEQT